MNKEFRFSDINLINEYKGKSKGLFFILPIKAFGKDCTRLYKILGFEKSLVYAQRINKRTGKVPGNAPIFETFDFDKIFK
jgi:hypothetical protein